jgi:hypothetical protein
LTSDMSRDTMCLLGSSSALNRKPEKPGSFQG